MRQRDVVFVQGLRGGCGCGQQRPADKQRTCRPGLLKVVLGPVSTCRLLQDLKAEPEIGRHFLSKSLFLGSQALARVFFSQFISIYCKSWFKAGFGDGLDETHGIVSTPDPEACGPPLHSAVIKPGGSPANAPSFWVTRSPRIILAHSLGLSEKTSVLFPLEPLNGLRASQLTCLILSPLKRSEHWVSVRSQTAWVLGDSGSHNSTDVSRRTG